MRRPVRDGLRAGSLLIAVVVLCKPLWVEAYRIPSASMQPTLLGPDASLRDVVLVDKVRYAWRTPRRFDLVAFRFPLRQTELHVKRIVGMPGDHLRIAGGDLWRVDGDTARPIAKRADLQERFWREVYPGRRASAPPVAILDEYFAASGAQWSTDGDDLIARSTGAGWAELTFTNPTDGGLADRLYDGYPAEIARVLRERAGRGVPFEAVQDARWTCTITPRAAIEVAIELTVRAPGRAEVTFALGLADGTGRLSVREAGAPRARSAALPCALAPDVATTISFARVDGTLHGQCGTTALTLDVADFARPTALPVGHVDLGLRLRGGGDGGNEVRITDLRIDRDLHYLPDGLIGAERTGLRVPRDHYFVLGDNPRESVDGRGWRAIELGVLADGRAADPSSSAGARRLSGALTIAEPPDENPLRIDDRRVVFADQHGNLRTMQCALTWTGRGPDRRVALRTFDDVGRAGAPWQPAVRAVRFLPRGAILGRPFLRSKSPFTAR